MEKQSDRLRLEGIFRKGYGIVPKFVMHDRDLRLESKAIYAYLCALAGSGDQTFPYRDTILRELGLSKNTYYGHYKPLIEQGYITVERPSDKTAANIYTLVSNPKKLLDKLPQPDKDKAFLRYRGLKAHGYGTIPRAVMVDERLSVKAKGLYAYFCSYCGAGDCAFPRRQDILFYLGLSEPTYYKALNQLKDTGYVTAVQRLDGTKFAVNDYYLNEHPGEKPQQSPSAPFMQADDNTAQATGARHASGLRPPYPKNCDITQSPSALLKEAEGSAAQSSGARRSTLRVPCIRFRDIRIPYTRIRDTWNWDAYINNKSSNNSSSKISPSSGRTDGQEWWWKELRGRASERSLDQRAAYVCTLGEVRALLRLDKPSEKEAVAAEWLCGLLEGANGTDSLWDALTAFLAHFARGMVGKNPRSMTDYLRASLLNWIVEQPLREEMQNASPSRQGRGEASYDLAEMERMVDGGIV